MGTQTDADIALLAILEKELIAFPGC